MELVADNIHVINPIIAAALEQLDPVPFQQMARECEEAGASAIDINPGPLRREAEVRMAFIVEAVQSATKLPILIDTANRAAMEAGLEAATGRTILNGFSLEPSKVKGMIPLAKKFDVEIIGYLLRPDGHVPADASERLSLAVELLHTFQGAGLDSHKLIIDPVIVPVSWQNGTAQAGEVLTALRLLPDLLGFPVKTIAGLSNLTTGKGYRKERLLLERTYLPMLFASGLDMALMNILHRDTVQAARACCALGGESVFAWEEIS